MNAIDLSVIGLQILLPLFLISWTSYKPVGSRLGFSVQVFATGLVLTALLLVSVWMVLPWWTPYAYLSIWFLASLWHGIKRFSDTAWLPGQLTGWASLILFAALAGWAGMLTVSAVGGRTPPTNATVINIAFPMGPGTYIVVSGGADQVVNGHFLTLHPKTDRQRAYRGQSYGLDLIKIDRLGFRTEGWRPIDPAEYKIFGEPVYAPCSGTIIEASDGMPDMPVPATDTSRLEGNHVLIDCGGFAVMLAHFKRGSVRVVRRDQVSQGQQIGEVGNSGQSTEPHLHIHVQRLPASGPLLSGEPIFFKLNGEFPVRNDRLKINVSDPLLSR